jgi:hypothetical protein
MPGKYKSLYQYLENRYANTVVLTFAQIEDLLGFTLPDSARVHQEWWANKDPNDTPPPHSIVDIGQQDSHAEPTGPDRCF